MREPSSLIVIGPCSQRCASASRSCALIVSPRSHWATSPDIATPMRLVVVTALEADASLGDAPGSVSFGILVPPGTNGSDEVVPAFEEVSKYSLRWIPAYCPPPRRCDENAC